VLWLCIADHRTDILKRNMSKYSDMELSGDAPEACEDVSEVASPKPVQMSTDLTFPTNDVVHDLVSLAFC
jgi:hypothetical protein